MREGEHAIGSRRDAVAKLDELKSSIREMNGWGEEELERLSDEKVRAFVRPMTRLIHDLLDWYSVDELIKETGLHREAIVVFGKASTTVLPTDD